MDMKKGERYRGMRRQEKRARKGRGKPGETGCYLDKKESDDLGDAEQEIIEEIDAKVIVDVDSHKTEGKGSCVQSCELVVSEG